MDPTKIIASDLQDLSESFPKVRFGGHSSKYHLRFNQFLGPDKKKIALPFPVNTCGFLYYHNPPLGAPRALGQVRFRITSHSEHHSFQAGHDLLRPNGKIWCIPLITIVSNASYIQHELIKQGLVEPDLVNRLANSGRFKLLGMSQAVYQVAQSWRIDVHHHAVTLVTMNIDSDLGTSRLFNILGDTRRRLDGSKIGYPYTGQSAFPTLRL